MKLDRGVVPLAIAIGFILALTGRQAHAQSSLDSVYAPIPGEYLVQMAPGTSQDGAQNTLADRGAINLNLILERFDRASGLGVVRSGGGMTNLNDGLASLRGRPGG